MARRQLKHGTRLTLALIPKINNPRDLYWGKELLQKGDWKWLFNIYVFKHPWISRPTTFRVFTIWTMGIEYKMEPIPPVEFGCEWILDCAKGSWGRIGGV
ncbi:unnamed protein product [Citrullus colocynthis]|uniref:Uncharacterized protein n=1 Tax=Citrullus colocynthis TaxID=252529 RepID=A0ABP0ZGE0_9ROSI